MAIAAFIAFVDFVDKDPNLKSAGQPGLRNERLFVRSHQTSYIRLNSTRRIPHADIRIRLH